MFMFRSCNHFVLTGSLLVILVVASELLAARSAVAHRRTAEIDGD